MKMGNNDVSFRFSPDQEPIDADILEVVPNPRSGVPRTDRHVAKEFSTNCPVDYGVEDEEARSEGVRDYGEVEIEYVPIDHIIELKTLKYYLMSYEDARISHEEVTSKIWSDLSERLYPDLTEEERMRKLYVSFDVNPRGGISSLTWTGSSRHD